MIISTIWRDFNFKTLCAIIGYQNKIEGKFTGGSNEYMYIQQVNLSQSKAKIIVTIIRSLDIVLEILNF